MEPRFQPCFSVTHRFLKWMFEVFWISIFFAVKETFSTKETKTDESKKSADETVVAKIDELTKSPNKVSFIFVFWNSKSYFLCLLFFCYSVRVFCQFTFTVFQQFSKRICINSINFKLYIFMFFQHFKFYTWNNSSRSTKSNNCYLQKDNLGSSHHKNQLDTLLFTKYLTFDYLTQHD